MLYRSQFADHEHRACDEAKQFDWLASQLSGAGGKPLALFLHKPLFLTPDDPELPASAIRYVPQPVRGQLVEMFDAVDLRLIASGHVHQRRDFTSSGTRRHVWAPSAGFIISDKMQEVIGIKEVGLVEYCFQPDGFEVRHVRTPGQVNVWLDELLGPVSKDEKPHPWERKSGGLGGLLWWVCAGACRYSGSGGGRRVPVRVRSWGCGGGVVRGWVRSFGEVRVYVRRLTLYPARPAPAACRNWRP